MTTGDSDRDDLPAEPSRAAGADEAMSADAASRTAPMTPTAPTTQRVSTAPVAAAHTAPVVAGGTEEPGEGAGVAGLAAVTASRGDAAAAGSEADGSVGVESPSGRRPLVHRHHWLVRVTHWVNAVLLAGMIASGLQIYAAYRYFGPRGGPFYPNPWTGKTFPNWATLGGWLAGALNWHFFLAWPFVLGGLAYLLYLVLSGEWRSLLFRPRDVPRAVQMQLYYLRLRKDHPPQGKHNALQKAAYNFIILLAAVSVLSGFAIYKPDQLPWLTRLFGGYELARYWHFWAVFVFLAFTLVHVTLVFVVDPASLRAMITGWYRGRFPSHE